MKIVVAASPKAAIFPIKHLISVGHQVLVATPTDQHAGRGRKLKPSPIAVAFADAVKVENEKELQKLLQNQDLLITIGFGWILKPETLSIPKFGGINLHFSLLPKWRGAAPVQRAIEAGEDLSGVSVFQMDQGMDTGPIWLSKSCQIFPGDNSLSLFEKLSEMGGNVLVHALEMIEAGKTPKPQEGIPTFAKKISKAESIIDWALPATKIINKIRAFAENPVATCQIRGEVLKIVEAKSSDTPLKIGELSKFGEVGTGLGSIQLIKVIPAGRREMDVKDWLNGFKPREGECFE